MRNTNVLQKGLFLLFISLLSFQSAHATKVQMTNLDRVNFILLLNEKMHKSYFVYNENNIFTLAKNMNSEISKLKKSKLKSDLMKNSLSKLKMGVSRKKANFIYHRFSLKLMKLVKKYNKLKTYREYYCPMVRKSWVQNILKIKEVQNPYAPNMKNCGRII